MKDKLVWPNGEGASLLRRRLWVRVPPRVSFNKPDLWAISPAMGANSVRSEFSGLIGICSIGWGSLMPPQPMQQPANPHPICSNSRLPWPIHALYLGGMRAFCAAQMSCLLGGFGSGLVFSHDYGPLTDTAIFHSCTLSWRHWAWVTSSNDY